MKVLIVKLSSLGDVIHTLPALSDAALACPDIQFDWIVEEGFQEIPKLHRAKPNVITIALRRWRKNIKQALFSGELRHCLRQLRATKYDYVIDAQGILKSAVVSCIAQGKRIGYSRFSIRDKYASYAYHQTVLPQHPHMVDRARELFASTLGYAYPTSDADFGIDPLSSPSIALPFPYVVFLHGTTWDNKHWPEIYWHQLAKLVTEAGIHVVLSFGNLEEEQRAKRIAGNHPKIIILPKSTMSQWTSVFKTALAVVSVDTGLGHLAFACGTRVIHLFGPTDPSLVSGRGEKSINLTARFSCAPCLKRICTYSGQSAVFPACFESIPPELVWTTLEKDFENEQTLRILPESTSNP